MDDPIHSAALSGDGALEFAQNKGFPTCDPSELISQHAIERVKIGYEDVSDYINRHYKGEPVKETQNQETYDTVSAVAMDSKGHLACAT
jgi:isoaspartyl peptidase/L-asparaginase-like protein (Ntn-hydrolase superfamily)